jgi:PhzF family phenazine biosynthesis protein
MQQIALEMNAPETAFLVGRHGSYNLRWFTPLAEVDLCGHATLAAAHALWSEWGEGNEIIRFDTLSGELVATRTDGTTWLDFPSEPVSRIDLPEIKDAIGINPIATCENRMDLLVEVASESAVRSLEPDLRLVATLGRRGLIVTASADTGSRYDFVSRFFAPTLGIDEDPVTGSAHCALAPYWAERLGGNNLIGYQASTRGGFVHVRVDGNRVHLGGEAVTVLSGKIRNIE